MITNSPKIIFSIIFLIIAMVWSLDVMGSSSLKRPNAPSKSDLEKIFGKSTGCPTNVAKTVCYNGGFVVVYFNSSDHVQSIMINTIDGLSAITRIADEITQQSNRGKLLNRVEKTKPGCVTNYTEDYKYLTIEYYEYNCQNSIPASIKIVWKK